jgi:hypothetical protein
MALDFPTSPSIGQRTSIDNKTWEYNGKGWKLVPNQIQGIQGTQGIQGYQGTQGLQGLSNQGSQGLQGPQGLQGSSNQGTQGTQGLSNQGTQGLQGLQGLSGLFAGQGAQGTQGISGVLSPIGSDTQVLYNNAGVIVGAPELTYNTGAVLIGSGTSTGTASQRLQVTGGAYVSDNLGVGVVAPSFKADIAGDARVTSTNKMRFGGTSGTTNFYIQYNSTANSLDFVAG